MGLVTQPLSLTSYFDAARRSPTTVLVYPTCGEKWMAWCRVWGLVAAHLRQVAFLAFLALLVFLLLGFMRLTGGFFLDLMELLTNVDPTWNICSKCCRHLSTAYLVMWKLPETFSVTVDVVVNSSAWRYTFHGKWQKKWLLCERLEGEVSKWVSKIGGFQKEGSHLMILVSPISADLQRKPSNGSGFWYIFATFLARSWSLELRSWPEPSTWDGISAMVPPTACRVAGGSPSWRCSIGDALFSMRHLDHAMGLPMPGTKSFE